MSTLSSYPLISIVIPTYNRVVFLQKAIASIRAQTYDHWELLVVEDGSTDNTAGAIYSLRDPRIRLVVLQHSGNIALLRNAGARAGCGEWIAFLDSDDEWVPAKLETQLCSLLREKKNWSYGGYELINEASQRISYKSGVSQPVSGWIAEPLITTEVAVNIGSLMITRKLFDEVGGFNAKPGLICREDYELALRLAMKEEALGVPEVLVRVREHAHRTTNILGDGHEKTAFVYQHFLKSKPGNKFEQLARKRMAYHLAEVAVNCMQNRKYLPATYSFARAFINGDSPRHLLSVIRRGLGIRINQSGRKQTGNLDN